ncbi:hypothetical protein BKP35_10885 [Anaerobacillus arseniciselenatis]|uniref:histidine kinase n=1 Tax=Anaerobacillus arseniciselenatis TaxID=85682 RepID=A0A1S2LIF8_9BACI|nr:ATP-binding protein [Anaerobacillus arseniciselenatis]OIJ12302.1 hypothetical protein BKP35_10885 [Anaerobacillus arseniciselenatis]
MNKYQGELNTDPVGIQFISNDGTLLKVNLQWCQMIGLDDMSKVIGMKKEKWLSYMKKKFQQCDEFIAFVETVLNQENRAQEMFVLKTKSQDPSVFQVYYETFLQSEDYKELMFVYRDITKEFKVDQLKSEFISTVNHELRTPLSSVLGFTELMLTKDLKPERQKKYLTTIHKEAKRLTSLINDFLDVQRMEAGKHIYEKKSLDVMTLAKDVVESFKLQSPLHKFIIENTAKNTIVLADLDKMNQMLMNLISNAVKYSPDGGNVTLTFKNKEKQLLMEIKDEGLGIPKDVRTQIFTKFYRIDNSDRRQIGGTGLGLAICKEIVKAHEGEIYFTSEIAKGSTFTIELPVLETIELDLEVNDLIDHKNKPTLMIVEDDESLASLLKEEFNESGFNVHHTSFGSKALPMMKKYLPDAVVLDILLEGDLDGWAVIKEVKKDEKLRHVPIFISTALDEKDKGLALGADYYLTKPYQPSQLTKLILQTLLRKEKNGEILIPSKEDET